MTNQLQRCVYIVGLGWLGMPLALHLREQNIQIAGTVSSAQKKALIPADNLVDIYQLYSPVKEQLPAHRFLDATMVLNIPPGRRSFNANNYVSAMLSLIDYAMSCGLSHIVFISTTSVFNALSGIITSTTEPNANTASGSAHIAIETHLMTHYSEKSCIVRPSGLVGPTINAMGEIQQYRHPIFSMCHKRDIPNGLDPVNLIHQHDLIAAIDTIINKKVVAQAFNLASLAHPSRYEYYTWCAQQLALPKPGFREDDLAPQLERKPAKTIDATESFKSLSLTPIHSSPSTMLPTSLAPALKI